MKWLFLFPLVAFSGLALFEKSGEVPIKNIQIFGEMHSGTNFLEMLLLNNLEGVAIFSGQEVERRPFGQKHFPAWFTRSLFYHKSLKLHEEYWRLSKASDTLFIVIARDPYDWIRAMYKRPFHIQKSKTFGKFLRSEVRFKVSRDRVNAIDYNPETGKFFSNPLLFRSAKLANILHLPERVSHCYFINYEVLKNSPEETIAEISSLFSIPKKPGFTPVTTYKKLDVPYKGDRYFPISKKDLSFINGSLDWDIEERFGYRIKEDVK